MVQKAQPITVAHGDGIGPEIMKATLDILSHSGAKLAIETVEVGKSMYEKGYSTGIAPSMWDSIRNTKILLKAPITTPQGGGYKSLNVTLRKTLSLYANVRPSVAYHPYIKTAHPNMNLVIVRENEEDLYTGTEYRQTHNVYHAIKLITRTGCEKIIRYAFEYAVNNNRKKVTCLSKDNIMKMTDGTFHKVFDEIAKEYPQLENDHYIIDIGAARLANRPEAFDVVVTSNLYGDIVSDIVAEISGSVGLAGSANIGEEFAMFEAIHGSAPTMVGQDRANPSGLLHAAIMMLVHINQPEAAANIHNAWLRTLEDGVHTPDIYNPDISTKKVGTQEFAKEVIQRLGQKPEKTPVVVYKSSSGDQVKNRKTSIDLSAKKQLVGVDVCFDWSESVDALADKLNQVATNALKVQMISCRGLKVWPHEENAFSRGSGDHWSARYVPTNSAKTTSHQEVLELLTNLQKANLDFVKTEHLYSFDDTIGFTLSQGE